MRCELTQIYTQATVPPRLLVQFEATHDANTPMMVTGLGAQVSANGHVVIDRLVVDPQSNSLKHEDALFLPNQRQMIVMQGVLSHRGVEAVEATRRGGDVAVALTFASTMADAVEIKSAAGGPVYVAGRTRWNTFWCPTKSYPRSEWLKLLNDTGYGAVELFELPVQALKGDPPFASAVDHLREAEVAYRTGAYDTTLFKCRKAMESMAKHAANGDVKTGFKLALSEAFGADATRIKVFDAVISALSDMSHTLGRHEQYPPVVVTRQEAEFALSAHVRLVGLLTTSIAERRARNPVP